MLIAIDLQNDYLDPKGKFYIPASAAILDPMEQRIRQALAEDELIVYTRNIYPDSEYLERRADDIRWAEAIYPQFASLLTSGMPFDKHHYGIAPEEALRLKKTFQHLEQAFDQIEFIGVESNVCVLANINIIQNIFTEAKLRLNERHTASGDASLHEAALRVLEGLKIEVIRDL